MDFVRVGVPLNLVTWVAGVVAIPMFFPFSIQKAAADWTSLAATTAFGSAKYG